MKQKTIGNSGNVVIKLVLVGQKTRWSMRQHCCSCVVPCNLTAVANDINSTTVMPVARRLGDTPTGFDMHIHYVTVVQPFLNDSVKNKSIFTIASCGKRKTPNSWQPLYQISSGNVCITWFIGEKIFPLGTPKNSQN